VTKKNYDANKAQYDRLGTHPLIPKLLYVAIFTIELMVKLICYNIEYCSGLKGKWYDYFNIYREIFVPPKGLDKRIIEELKKFNPDILGLVEVDIGSKRADRDEAKFFCDGLEMKNFDEAVKYIDKGAGKLFKKLMPKMRKQAIALLTKYKIDHIKHHVLSKGVKRILIEVVVRCPKKVTILLAHLSLGKKARKKQLEDIANIVKQTTGHLILMGDFNTFAGEKEIDEILLNTRLENKAKLNHDLNHFTQPTAKPSRVLDYVLTSHDVEVNEYKILRIPLSDHLPVMIDFDLK